jgi:hypothetical protein
MLKWLNEGILKFRATSISKFCSALKVTSPSTLEAGTPASSNAASQASTASSIGVRPESFENSVAPIPTIAVSEEKLEFI